MPMGIGQMGRSFRNEITPGNFIFRTREFEQMELEFFCKPGTDLEWYEYWKNFCKNAIVKVNDLHLYKPFKTDEAKKIKRALFERGKKPQGILLVVFIV